MSDVIVDCMTVMYEIKVIIGIHFIIMKTNKKMTEMKILKMCTYSFYRRLKSAGSDVSVCIVLYGEVATVDLQNSSNNFERGMLYSLFYPISISDAEIHDLSVAEA